MLTTRCTAVAGIVIAVLGMQVLPGSMVMAQSGSNPKPTGIDSGEIDVPEALQGDFKPKDIAAATAWADQLHLADWLGPLAPLALSPFFGVACLSGLSLWGPQWVTDNALLNSASPLCSVPVFATFAVLTVVTSVPRMTKVSKPFAQAVDRIEAYAVIVILLVIKVMSSVSTGDVDLETQVALQGPMVAQAGVLSLTADTLLMIAMAINILVVNSVKFFFEFLAWLTPFPTIDAIFEICNKSLCAALMATYAVSPAIATALNLLILLAALLVFRWIGRRVKFHRTMLLDPVLARIWPAYAAPSATGLVAFCREEVGGYPAKTCLRLIQDGDGARLIPGSPWSPLNWGLRRDGIRLADSATATLTRGWLTHTITAKGKTGEDDEAIFDVPLTISRRHDVHLDELVKIHGLLLAQGSPDHAPADRTETAKIELA